ncbi:sushi, von Willebrand factor type A, EGF and pentraxin domain-containing protein 1-like isoform X3 [Ruditapes philippinarum]|uniref:sushi, von Willebrand factor type A, EGF and pentraxin domain-containing protein 1-like isoform X3 n=1 Tax=Ruditapes philippinarum TaxID=129788 RepID=UPI00295A6345|nr:sushi, von Willebrand factor type A, EGF and pentraxin domain-containing protein 1-like isoform X3 [Ruditapes philippinarum]
MELFKICFLLSLCHVNIALSLIFRENDWIANQKPGKNEGCGKLQKVKNGEATLDSKSDSSVGSTASITCKSGFEADQEKITCLETGKWEKATCTEIETKACGKLNKVKNGKATLDKKSTSTVRSTASIRCKSGFDADREKITCLETGEWEEATCNKQETKGCGKLKKVKNGKATLDIKATSTVGSTASIRCKSGFEADREKITCLETGEWEEATCNKQETKECGKLKKVKNGKATLDIKSTSTVGLTASIRCKSGFEADRVKITCLETGEWEEATCNKQETKECGKLKKVKNGKATLDIKATSTVGSTASIRCKSGFEADRVKITCLETGEWEEATCNKQGITDCGKPQKIKDGKATPDNKVNTTVGATASIRCKPGFESDRKTITCLKTGKWEKATCSDIDCGTPMNVTNGVLNYTTTTYQSRASLVCDAGYNGSHSTIRCRVSGSWDKATCDIKDCGTPSSVTNGALNFTTTTFGSSASLVCDTGYDASHAAINCLDTGSWETPTCNIKDCGSPANVTNGAVTFTTTTFGSSASIACDTGYNASHSTISCLDTGSWETATCTITDCGSPANVTNGAVTFTTTTFGSSSSIICDTGYNSSHSTVSCLDTGSWETATCIITDCGSPANVTNGAVTFTTTTFGSSASIACDTGYNASQSTVSCLETGSWETATCTITDCGSPANVTNGAVTFTTTTFGSSASIACDTGYNSSQSTVSCLDTGSWETTTCTITDCGSPANVTNGAVTFTTTTFGSSASIICDTGYNASLSTISCLDTGSWETATCTITDCGIPSNVTNGTLAFTTTTFGSNATLVCASGYNASHPQISCLENGSWETPTCNIAR